ncbi:hypothetical protein [Streptomyces phaeoluteigriseus]|uniref:hypothetical protein n=1 Tax=Streptomyces phaeoluteigriseus TaxID=114686 RepID=UPI0036941C4C
MKIFGNRATSRPGGPASHRDDCTDCGGPYDNYALRDEIWFGPARGRSDTVLCIPCLERRLRRRMTAADLKPEAFANDPNSRQWPKSPVYRDRARGWIHRPN